MSLPQFRSFRIIIKLISYKIASLHNIDRTIVSHLTKPPHTKIQSPFCILYYLAICLNLVSTPGPVLSRSSKVGQVKHQVGQGQSQELENDITQSIKKWMKLSVYKIFIRPTHQAQVNSAMKSIFHQISFTSHIHPADAIAVCCNKEPNLEY